MIQIYQSYRTDTNERIYFFIQERTEVNVEKRSACEEEKEHLRKVHKGCARRECAIKEGTVECMQRR